MRITSVLMNGSDEVRVQWSDAVGMTAFAEGGGAPVPAGVLQRNRSVIMVEVNYQYHTMFSELGVSQFDISEVFYLRPRQSIVVARSTALTASGTP